MRTLYDQSGNGLDLGQSTTSRQPLIEGFGGRAHYLARERARSERESGIVFDANRPAGHWDRVRREIGRRTGRDGLDTATRYMIEREREVSSSGRG